MKSYLVSWLAEHHRNDDLPTFERELRGPWLVWEPGPWRPTRERATMAARAERGRATSGDALVLEVSPRPGRAPFEGVRLGRGPENDLVVDDGTLSRAHLVLHARDDGWTLEDLRSSNGTRVDGVPVEAGPVRLESGTRIEAGAVRFSFYDAKGLYLRLKRVVV